MSMENDVVLIYYEDKPMSFARIEEIRPDVKKNWYLVRLLFLQIPLQTVTWILRDIYIQGEEFTMGGKKIRLDKVVAPAEEIPEEAPAAPQQKKPKKTKAKPKATHPEGPRWSLWRTANPVKVKNNKGINPFQASSPWLPISSFPHPAAPISRPFTWTGSWTGSKKAGLRPSIRSTGKHRWFRQPLMR
jgi:hypothetical protein